MPLTNNQNHSLSIAVWLATDRYNHNRYPGKAHMSATGLLKPLRMIILSERAEATKNQDTVTDISMNIPNRMGTAIHAGIEWAWRNNYKQALLDMNYPQRVIDRLKVNPTPEELAADPDTIAVYVEQRHHKEFLGFIIDGEFDFVGDGILEDFKTTGVYGYMKGNKDEEHILQGSIYRWLVPHIITGDFMRIQYTFTDWSKLDAMIRRSKGYPQSRIVPKKLQLLSLAETENFIRNKIELIKTFKDAPEPDLPQCLPEDLWQSAPIFKYFGKPENTRSSGNFDTYAEAHTKLMSAGKGIIKEVPGQVKRCGYCPAYDLCTQKDIYLNNGTLALP